jgi:hypothetical protein
VEHGGPGWVAYTRLIVVITRISCVDFLRLSRRCWLKWTS